MKSSDQFRLCFRQIEWHAIGSRERHAIDAHRGDGKKREDADIYIGWCDSQINFVAEQPNRVWPKRNQRNPSEGKRQSQQRRKIKDEFIDACGSRVFFEEKF